MAVREGKERVRTAILNTGFSFLQRCITVNLAPANRKKAGIRGVLVPEPNAVERIE